MTYSYFSAIVSKGHPPEFLLKGTVRHMLTLFGRKRTQQDTQDLIHDLQAMLDEIGSYMVLDFYQRILDSLNDHDPESALNELRRLKGKVSTLPVYQDARLGEIENLQRAEKARAVAMQTHEQTSRWIALFVRYGGVEEIKRLLDEHDVEFNKKRVW